MNRLTGSATHRRCELSLTMRSKHVRGSLVRPFGIGGTWSRRSTLASEVKSEFAEIELYP